MQSARVVLDRDAIIIDTETKCKTAIETKNLDLLNEALEAASQLGLRTATIEAGVTFRDELAVKEGTIKALVAACETKASSKGGITISDVEALIAAMAEGSDVISAMASRPEVMEAQELSTKMQSVLNVQEMPRACEAKVKIEQKGVFSELRPFYHLRKSRLKHCTPHKIPPLSFTPGCCCRKRRNLRYSGRSP